MDKDRLRLSSTKRNFLCFLCMDFGFVLAEDKVLGRKVDFATDPEVELDFTTSFANGLGLQLWIDPLKLGEERLRFLCMGSRSHLRSWECNSFDHNRNILFELYQTHTHVAHQDSDTTQDNVHMEISQVSCWKLHLETNKSTETTVQAFTTKLLSFWVQELEGLCRSPC